MRSTPPILATALALGLGVTAASLPYDPTVSCSPTMFLNSSSIDTVNATAFALLASKSALCTFIEVANRVVRIPSRFIRPNFQANAIQNKESLATENAQVLVRPNVHTMYSKAAIDLSHADVVLSLPDMPEDRYHVVLFYDLCVAPNRLASCTPTSSNFCSKLQIRKQFCQPRVRYR
jgi:hypothetical protein